MFLACELTLSGQWVSGTAGVNTLGGARNRDRNGLRCFRSTHPYRGQQHGLHYNTLEMAEVRE